MRMRGLDEGFKEIRANDPGTALTKSAFRRLVTTGRIPSVKIGTKYLVDLDVVERYYSGTGFRDRRDRERNQFHNE